MRMTEITSNETARNTSYAEMSALLDAADEWFILSHVKPDGDTLGSGSALYAAGVARGKRVSWAGPSAVPDSYSFLPYIDKYLRMGWIELDSYKIEDMPLFICVDVATLKRTVGGLHGLWTILNIDHHADNSRYGAYNHIEPSASSVCEVLWDFMNVRGWNISYESAVGLYTGILTDSGNFAFNSTSRRTHIAAADLISRGIKPDAINTAIRGNRTLEGMHLWGLALSRMRRVGTERQIGFTYLMMDDFRNTGAKMSETEFLVNQLLLIHGVKFAFLIIDDVTEVRVSFRGVQGGLSAGMVARHFGGGGHKLAAAATFFTPLEEVLPAVLNFVENCYLTSVYE